MTRKLETYIQPGGDPKLAPVASPQKMKDAEYLICRKETDDPPGDIAKAIEFRGYCTECGAAIIHRALPNPNIKLVCIYCWDGWRRR